MIDLNQVSLKTVEESGIKIEVLDDAARIYDSRVFFNPKMSMNRDVSLLCISCFLEIEKKDSLEQISYLDALAGSGIRGFRVVQQLSDYNLKVIINDKDKVAYDLIVHNYDKRESEIKEKIEVYNADANDLAQTFALRKEYLDIIDIDPFGSPSPFLESSLSAIKHNGMLLVTATDMQPLCGLYPKAARRKYDAVIKKTDICHEVAVRVLLGWIARRCASRNMAIFPLFSYASDHYIRIVVKIEYGKQKADMSLDNLGMVLYSSTGEFQIWKDITELTGIEKKFEKILGPLWIGNVADKAYLEIMKKQIQSITTHNMRRLEKIIQLIESNVGKKPFYYNIHRIASRNGCVVPSFLWLLKSLEERGYYCEKTHYHKYGIKTDASLRELIEIMKEWNGGTG